MGNCSGSQSYERVSVNTTPLIDSMSTEDKGRFLELIIQLKQLESKIDSCKTMNETKDLYVNSFFPIISELASLETKYSS